MINSVNALNLRTFPKAMELRLNGYFAVTGEIVIEANGG